GVIRASVTLNHSVGETKSVAPPLEIKLPVPLEMRREDNAVPSATQVKLKQQSEERYSSPLATPIGTNNDDMEEDEEDEDDWDAFQEKILSDLAVEEVKDLSAKIEEHVQRKASTETGHNEDAEGSINVAGDDEQQKESSDNKVDTDLVSDTLPHVGLSDTETEEEAEHNMDQEQH
ncbi:hypothetical protein Golax_016129, partial [Gossypium laxum]|nr:hypothetical protein [Gossypium laxum]